MLAYAQKDAFVFCVNFVESPDSLMCEACSTGTFSCDCPCAGCNNEEDNWVQALPTSQRLVMLRRLQRRRRRTLWWLQRRRRRLALWRCTIWRMQQRRRRMAYLSPGLPPFVPAPRSGCGAPWEGKLV